MKQENAQRFESECKMAHLFVHNDMSLGALHDFLYQLKSFVINKINEIEKEISPDKESVQEEVNND